MKRIYLGKNKRGPYLLHTNTLKRHKLVTGNTGSGKSVYLQNVAYEVASQGVPVAIIDRDGKTARDSYSMLRKFGAILLRPTERPFRIDPGYQLRTLVGADYDKALVSLVDDLATSFADIIGEDGLSSQLRRSKSLDYTFYLCLQRREDGKYPGLNHLQRAVDFGTKAWYRNYFNPVAGSLPAEIEDGIASLVSQSMPQIRKEMESSVNIIDHLMRGQLMKEVFRPTGNTLSATKLAKKIVCVDLKEGNGLSTKQANCLGSIMANLLIDAAQAHRGMNVVIIDEADLVVGPRVVHICKRARKTDTALVLGTQEVKSLKTEKHDIGESILSVVGTVVSFQTQSESELKTVGNLHAIKMLSWKRNWNYQQFADGYRLLTLQDTSESTQEGDNWTEAETAGGSKAKTRSEAHGSSEGGNEVETRTNGNSQTNTEAKNSSETKSKSKGASESSSSGRNDGQQWFIDDDYKMHMKHNNGGTSGTSEGTFKSTSDGETEGWSSAIANAASNSISNALGFVFGWSFTETNGETDTTNWSKSKGKGGSRGKGRTITKKKVPIAKHRIKKTDGGLVNLPEVQIRRTHQRMSNAAKGVCVISSPGKRTQFIKAHMRPVANLFHKRSECWNSPIFFDVPEAQKCRLPRETKRSSNSSSGQKRGRKSGR